MELCALLETPDPQPGGHALTWEGATTCIQWQFWDKAKFIAVLTIWSLTSSPTLHFRGPCAIHESFHASCTVKLLVVHLTIIITIDNWASQFSLCSCMWWHLLHTHRVNCQKPSAPQYQMTLVSCYPCVQVSHHYHTHNGNVAVYIENFTSNQLANVMEPNPSWEANSHSPTQFRVFYITRRLIAAFTRAHHCIASWPSLHKFIPCGHTIFL